MQLRLVVLALLCLPLAWGQTGAVWTPELSMQVDTIGEVVPSPDGRWVAYTQTAAVMEEEKSEMVTQIYLALADGTRRLQLTRGEDSAGSPAFSPDGSFVYFSSSRSGGRNVWRIALAGGEAERVTDWEGSIGAFRVSPDGRRLAFTGRKKDPDIEKAKKQKRDLRVIDEDTNNHALWLGPSHPGAEDGAAGQLVDDSRHIETFEWSPDGKRIVYEHQPRNEPDFWMQADISEVDIEGKAVTKIAAEEYSERSPKYSPDGKLLAYIRSSSLKNWAGEGRFVVKDLSTGKLRTLALTHDESGRGTNLLGFSSDSKRVLFTETQGVRNVLVGMDIDGKPRNLGFPEKGTLASYGGGSRLNAAGTHIGAAAESLTAPVEAYVFDVKGGKGTKSSDAHSNQKMPPLGTTEVIRWKSKDGMEIEGLLTYPVRYERGKKVPLALVIHGGPMGVFTETFIGARGLYPVAAFASKGYAVLQPNPRGSSGYGLKFRVANMNDWGGGDYEDIMSGVDYVIGMGVADPDRMAVMGWSYGGFMTSWIVGQTDRFKAACVGAAVTNLWSFTGTSDILDFLPGYFKGEPWENFEGYREHSPMNYVQNVKTPSLILHGEADLRVPISQGYEFYNALKRRGVETKMVVYPRQPHGPTEPKFLLDVAKRHLAWTEEHLAK